MQPAPPGLEQLKQKMRSTWMAGDFGQIARYSAQAGEDFVSRLNIKPTDRVLDVACGTGNSAIPAARTGATVTGADIASNLLEQARQRAQAEGLKATFEEGDAEQLPYADGQFDVVMSMFGAMFAPRPDRVAAELVRVCRPGGTIAMANWPPDGFIAMTFKLGARFIPPPEGIPSPLLWGDEHVVKERLAAGTSAIRATRQKFVADFPFPPADVVQLFRAYFGPVHVTYSRLDPQRQNEYTAEMEKLWREHNEASGDRTLVHSDFLEVVATRA